MKQHYKNNISWDLINDRIYYTNVDPGTFTTNTGDTLTNDYDAEKWILVKTII